MSDDNIVAGVLPVADGNNIVANQNDGNNNIENVANTLQTNICFLILIF
jgi:hypothetical protein